MARFTNEAGQEVKTVQTRDLLKVAAQDILVDWTQNGRSSKPDFSNLVDSIKKVGQLQPVLCRRNSEGKLQLVAGYCRVDAIKQINKERGKDEQMPVSLVVQNINEEEAFIRNLQENMARNATSPMDDAHNLRRLKEQFGKDTKEAAKTLGKTETWVRQTEKLLTLDTKTQSLLHKGEMGWAAGVMLADVEESKRKEIVKTLDEEATAKFEEAKDRVAKAAEKNAKKASKKQADIVDVATADDSKKKEAAPAKVPTKRIETKKVAKAVREAGSKSSIATPNRSAIKDFFDGLIGPGETALTRDLANLMLDFMSGKISDQAAEKKFRKLTTATAE